MYVVLKTGTVNSQQNKNFRGHFLDFITFPICFKARGRNFVQSYHSASLHVHRISRFYVEKGSEGKYGEIESNALIKHLKLRLLCFSFECYYLPIKEQEICVVFFNTKQLHSLCPKILQSRWLLLKKLNLVAFQHVAFWSAHVHS